MADKVITLPDGKVSVNGVVMSSSTYRSRYKSGFPADKKSIASNPDKTSRPTAKKAVKVETKAAKQNTRILKKVDKANYSPNADAARKKAAERAKAVAPEKRTAAQTRAIKTESRYKVGLPGYSAGPVTKEVKKTDKKFARDAAKSAKAKAALRGGRGMGGGGLSIGKVR
jgi:hypothetical protein